MNNSVLTENHDRVFVKQDRAENTVSVKEDFKMWAIKMCVKKSSNQSHHSLGPHRFCLHLYLRTSRR